MNQTPTEDGQIEEFVNPEAEKSRYFDRTRRVVFINGMKNSGENLKESALALSLLQMCAVIGLYNRSTSFVADLGECIADKWQFHGVIPLPPLAVQAASASQVIEQVQAGAKATGLPVPGREQIILKALGRNAAAAALFGLLRPLDKSTHIFAHSQGNLILSNVLTALEAVDGPASIEGRVIHSYGSPSVNWPKGITHLEHGFTWDPVTWLAGFDWSLSISKVGVPGGATQPFAHAFTEYMKNDAAFVVNRHCWKMAITFSMNEEALGKTLVGFALNLPRVLAVFQYLERNHYEDFDDVALQYVQQLRHSAEGPAILRAVKAFAPLHQSLIRAMERGWTSAKEKEAIQFLRSL